MGLEFIWLAPARQAHTAYKVPGVGLEPTRPNGHRILSPACLPIPPSGREWFRKIANTLASCKLKSLLHAEGF